MNTAKNKCYTQGVKNLTNLDILTLVTRNREIAENLLAHFGSLNAIRLQSVDALMLVKGVTELIATTITASFELSVRADIDEIGPKITSSKDASFIFNSVMGNLPHEEFWAIYLSRSNRILKTHKISQGGLSATVTDARLIMAKGIEVKASSIIIGHNHPSGNLDPSESDHTVTRKIKEAGRIMNMPVLDHIIIGHAQAYYSFADEGYI